MKFFVIATCVYLTVLNVTQCISQLNNTYDAMRISSVMQNNEIHQEEVIIDILVRRSNAERQELRKEFKKIFNKDLMDELAHFFAYDIKEAVMALLVPSSHFYAYQLHHAMEGFGTDENALSEILGSMNNEEILKVTSIYKNDFNASLIEDIISETSGTFKYFLTSMCNVVRNESQVVDRNAAILDAYTLLDARKGHKNNTYYVDEMAYVKIFTTRSLEQLLLVFEEYSNAAKMSIIQGIKNEFYGELQFALMVIVKAVFLNDVQFYAVQLRESMMGLGTDDRQLIRIVVGRSEIDLKEIRELYKIVFNTELADSISSETSGKYKDLLISLVHQ